MEARVVHDDPRDGSEAIEVNGHHLQFGGQGDGFCYEHQSFNCIDNLTKEEWDAIHNIEYPDPEGDNGK